MYILPAGKELTAEKLSAFIKKHKADNSRLKELKKMYESEHKILNQPEKEGYKPDNRLVVNFAKYIVDTFNGFFIGIPIKANHEKSSVNDYLQYLDKYNNLEDSNAELSKMCSIYGKAYELIYMDEDANVGVVPVKPLEAFVVYDNSLLHRPVYGVRYYMNEDGELEGSYSSKNEIVYFNDEYKEISREPHYFGGVPLIEYRENEETKGIFEAVETLINAYDKALSEKANDVDYFSDAYLKILGAALDEATLKKLRDSRIINLSDSEENIVVEFLEKPSADDTQENLINRLEKLIFLISMVANINDEEFGSASGVALEYKLQPMMNLAKTKERKFTAGLNKRYKLISNIPTTKMSKDDWIKIDLKFTRNIPKNLLEESQIAKNISGISSKETQLSVLSCVKDVKAEKEKIEAENDEELLARSPEETE